MAREATYFVTLQEHEGQLGIQLPPQVIATLGVREGDEIIAIQEGSSFLLKAKTKAETE
jgi:hypothetical protein